MDMSAITRQVQSVADRFNGLNLRERWLLFVAAAVLLFLLVDSFALAPAGRAVQNKQAQIASAQARLDGTKQQMASLQGVIDNNPLSLKIRERDTLQQQVTSLEDELSELAGGLVKAEKLPQILEQMLVKSNNLQLREMVISPAEEQLAGVYKHQVTMKLQGGFVDVLAYLKALEESSWKFYWQELGYQVEHYPRAEVELQIYTLSTGEGIFNG